MRAMTMVDRLVVCLACLSLCAPPLAAALELGAIEVRSARYEPLDARIPLHDLRSGDLEGLTVALGTSARFERAGVARPNALDLLELSVVRPKEGAGYVQVRTAEPIIEPSLTFLVEVGWPHGHAVRTYTLEPGAAAAPQAESSDRTGTTRDPEAASVSPPPAAQGDVYGPVRRTDTLWSIATRVRPDDSVSVHRMMLALLEANPEAFATRNVNALYADAVLRIPTREELGPGEDGAVAEVRRQQAQWEQRGASRRASAPSPTTTAPPEAEPGPGGRIEIASPASTGGTAPQDDDAAARALRKRLALAREDTDALQRQNDEIEQRLAEAEDRIRELSRLIELKNEEIAALEEELRARVTAAPMRAEVQPQPASPRVETGPEPVSPDVAAPPEPVPQEIAADRQLVQANVGAAAEPAPDRVEAESPPIPSRQEPRPVPAVAEAEPRPTLAAAEDEPKPTLAQVGPEPKPPAAGAQGEPEPAPAETAPESLSSTLRAAVDNPVYAAGGAGVLLMGLGVAALLVRRRASATSGGARDLVGEPRDSRAGEDDILVELEAVTADLADETGRDPLDVVEADRAADAIELDLDALADGHDDFEPLDDEASDSFAISFLADLADEGKDATTESDAEASGDLEYLLRRYGDTGADSEAREPTPASGAGTPTDSDGEGEPPAAAGRDDAPPRSDTPGAERRDADRASAAAARGSVEGAQDADDGPGGTKSALHPPLEDSLHGDVTEATSIGDIGDIGDDEMETKTDLAQLYMEMGDAERARAFLEAVMAKGDAEQRETARELLARLA